MSNPNNCETCRHKPNGEGGWCYMFRDEPSDTCYAHTEREPFDFLRELKRLALGKTEWAAELTRLAEVARRTIALEQRRDEHVSRGYVSHEQHRIAVQALDAERLAIVELARAALGAKGKQPSCCPYHASGGPERYECGGDIYFGAKDKGEP